MAEACRMGGWFPDGVELCFAIDYHQLASHDLVLPTTLLRNYIQLSIIPIECGAAEGEGTARLARVKHSRIAQPQPNLNGSQLRAVWYTICGKSIAPSPRSSIIQCQM